MTRAVLFFLLLVFSVFNQRVLGSAITDYGKYKQCHCDTLKMVELTNKKYGRNAFKILLLRDVESGSRKIIVLKSNFPVDSIQLPNPDDYAGFSVNWIRESETGFNLSVEYGTKNYYSKDFYFSYVGDSFYLVKIKVQHFNMNKRENGKNKVIWVNPNLLLHQFRLEEFL